MRVQRTHGVLAAVTTITSPVHALISVPATPLSTAHAPLEHFLSYSIELSSLADFTGNLTHPNNYSLTLLNNLAHYSGSLPILRVGGNTQDLTLFNASQTQASIPTYDPENPDYPASLTIGPTWFDSYRVWPNVTFSHGFNLAANSTTARQALLDSVRYACAAIPPERLYAWELGNEPDLYRSGLVGKSERPASWAEPEYVGEWLRWTRKLRKEMHKECPAAAGQRAFRFLAPSLAGSAELSTMNVGPIFDAGLVADASVGIVAAHKYIASRGSPGITFQGTLLNHSANAVAVEDLLDKGRSVRNSTGAPSPSIPFILAEGNSLARQGIGGVSNAFGAALWGLDYGLQLASRGMGRWHMHQGTNYRYQAWQPIETSNTTRGTKAPYYGNVALTAFLGDLTDPGSRPRVQDLSSNLQREDEGAFVSFVRGKMEKIMLINMREWNTTAGGEDLGKTRPVEQYDVQLPEGFQGKKAQMRRLMANGSDAITGVTFDGYSYALELDGGRPVCLENVTRGESVEVGQGGKAAVMVPWSSAVVLDFGMA